VAAKTTLVFPPTKQKRKNSEKEEEGFGGEKRRYRATILGDTAISGAFNW